MIMFRPGDPLNCSWCSPGVSLAGGQAGAVLFPLGIGRFLAGVQPWSSLTRGVRVAQAGRRAEGLDCRRTLSYFAGKSGIIGWLLLWVFPADGVRVG